MAQQIKVLTAKAGGLSLIDPSQERLDIYSGLYP